MSVLKSGTLSQERIVFLFAIALFAAYSALLDGFLAPNNLVAILRSVSVLGILAVGMGIVVIGRGIDLSMVAVMAMATAWQLAMMNAGISPGLATAIVFAGVVAVGIINGLLIAYAEVPVVFATLATASFVFGLVRSRFIVQDAVPVPPSASFILEFGQARIATCPSRW
jgi:Ribose/xylose/arabinose/galactoside ABC-type transport systems, permease components